jgi:hypothetical protein
MERMSAKAETAITRRIIQWIKKQGGDAWHVHGSLLQPAGEPDIDGWLPSEWGNIHLKIEVKTVQGKPTPLQLVKLRKYHKAGYLVGVVTSPHGLGVLVSCWLEEIARTLQGNPKSFKQIYEDTGYVDEYKLYED